MGKFLCGICFLMVALALGRGIYQRGSSTKTTSSQPSRKDTQIFRTDEQIMLDASKNFKVPLTILKAVYVKETGKGRNFGKSHAIDMLNKQINSTTGNKKERYIAHQTAFHRIIKKCGYPERIPGSSTGAIGHMQCMPKMCEVYGVDDDGDGTVCPLTMSDSVATAANHLRHNYDRLGSWFQAVRAYNGRGPQARAYARKVLQLAGHPTN